jgi:SAM-dependent methyltransferase
LLAAAGFDVVGFDISSDLVALARETVPSGRFDVASFVDAELPPCVAVTAIGECFNYVADSRIGRTAIPELLTRVHDALAPGGILLFDVAAVGREPAGRRRDWHEGENWLLCLEVVEDAEGRLLTRRMAILRRDGDAWRRADEVHRLRLVDRRELLDDLSAAGFKADVGHRYGDLRLPAGLLAVSARRDRADRDRRP